MSDNYVKTKHDIGVTNTNGDVVGLMLAQKPDGTPAYAVFDRKHLADQFFTGENPVGKTLIMPNWGDGDFYMEIIGVVGDLKDYGLASEML